MRLDILANINFAAATWLATHTYKLYAAQFYLLLVSTIVIPFCVAKVVKMLFVNVLLLTCLERGRDSDMMATCTKLLKKKDFSNS